MVTGVEEPSYEEMRAFLGNRQDRDKLRRRAIGICYDRGTCRDIGVGYTEITEGDIVRIEFLLATKRLAWFSPKKVNFCWLNK